MQAGLPYDKALDLPYGVLLNYVAIHLYNTRDVEIKDKLSQDDEFDILLGYK